MNMLAIILLQVECVQDLSIIGFFLRMQFKIRIIQRLSERMPGIGGRRRIYSNIGGNITMPTITYGMKIMAQNVTGIKVPNSGHFIPEEHHFFYLSFFPFFRSHSTTLTTQFSLLLLLSILILVLSNRNDSSNFYYSRFYNIFQQS